MYFAVHQIGMSDAAMQASKRDLECNFSTQAASVLGDLCKLHNKCKCTTAQVNRYDYCPCSPIIAAAATGLPGLAP